MNYCQYCLGTTKGKEKKKTSHKKISPMKLPVVGEVLIQLTPDQNHPISHSSAKTTGKSCPPWELELHPTKTIGHKPITIANYATVNAMVTQNTKTSETMNHVLLVANNCSTKEYGTTFLVKEKPATHHVNTQFSLITGIYTIPEEEKPISSCTSELDSTFNSNLNPNNNDNNGSSSVQNNNSNNNGNLNSDLDSKQYIALSNLSKKQEFRWFSDNDESIMPECTHDTDVRFDLRYLRKNAIKLKPHSHICIDLKVALEISRTIMIQLASRSSLVKKKSALEEE
ncbi:hypothetical protein G9A89_005172 [Geosiphon pyriformis]|nr:hypothetical protein G9A89_005172 [Geosiphon pyriformis]